MPFTSTFTWEHKDLKDVSTPHKKDDMAPEMLRWNEFYRVKLPDPLASDYLSPASADTGQVKPPNDTQPSYYVGQSLFNGGSILAGEHFTNLDGYIDSIACVLSRSSYPTGTVKMRIQCPGIGLNVTEDFMQVEDLTHHAESYVFTPLKPYRVKGETWIMIYFDGGDSVNHLTVHFATTGNYSNGIWTYGTEGNLSEQSFADWSFDITYRDPDLILLDDDTAIPIQYAHTEQDINIILDLGGDSITGAIRIYWPTSDRIAENLSVQVAYGGSSTYEEVFTRSVTPSAIGWEDILFNARYIRYIKIVMPNNEARNLDLSEVDYYSLITDRVASEHGHGSGVERAHNGHNSRLMEDIVTLIEDKQDIEAMAKLLLAIYRLVV